MRDGYFYDKWQKKIDKPEDAPVDWRPSAYGYSEKDGKVLMIREPGENKIWELPGGGVEISETGIEGLKREWIEETGYAIEVESEAPMYVDFDNYFYWKSRTSFHQVIFLCWKVKILEDVPRDTSLINQVDGDEVEEMKWIDLNDLNEENVIRFHWPLIKKMKEHYV